MSSSGLGIGGNAAGPDRLVGGAVVRRASTAYTSPPLDSSHPKGSVADWRHHSSASGTTRSVGGAPPFEATTRHSTRSAAGSAFDPPPRGRVAPTWEDVVPVKVTQALDDDERAVLRGGLMGQLSNSQRATTVLSATPEVSSLLSSASTMDPAAMDFHLELKRRRMHGEGRRASSAANAPLEDSVVVRDRMQAIVRGESDSRSRPGDSSPSVARHSRSAVYTDTTRTTPTRDGTVNTESNSLNDANSDEATSVISASTTDREQEQRAEEQRRRRHMVRLEGIRMRKEEEHERREALRAAHRREMIAELPFGTYAGSRLVTPVDRGMVAHVYTEENGEEDDDEGYNSNEESTLGAPGSSSAFASTVTRRDLLASTTGRGGGLAMPTPSTASQSQRDMLSLTTGSNSVRVPVLSKKKKAALALSEKQEAEAKWNDERLEAQQMEAISVAQYALKEASRHALSLQDMLAEIHARLEDQESERLRIQHRIEVQIEEGVRMDSSATTRKLKHEDLLQTLKSRIAYLESETSTDRDEKIRLLKIVDMYVNGGPTPTLADWSFHHYINTVGQFAGTAGGKTSIPDASPEHKAHFVASSASNAAVSFARVMSALPDTNRDLLMKQKFFDFSNQVIDNAVVQYRRSRLVSSERAVIGGAVAVGLNVSLVELMSYVSADDLPKL